MLHHYLQKGITPEYILGLDWTTRLFYQASMEVWLKEEGEKLKLLRG
ncbi:hypothetical protein BR63_19210 [Thermanaerosceptrum fracticalcis]|uniref:Uncharacterized protein n=1 Tax=Thermanaerosceptrum fracticalcis TaxID=1712410 RepID=A0A7G6E807_THEFR|nr:hypothetical protein [Thermanaerosceptrum fracticalcis]QNB48211.1 hypothetical protein BR63_19210 [Thermanaerosceptrum fracticalcis]